MDRTKAVELLKKALGCLQTDPKDCASKKCSMCKHNATKEDGIEAIRMAIAALEKAAILNGNTLTIKVSEEDIDKVKRVMLDSKPWCRTFYEDVPGEAHWIKKYTPDDGEIYECDNCGVTWQFNEGGPEENEAFYCPKCGFKMGRGEAE